MRLAPSSGTTTLAAKLGSRRRCILRPPPRVANGARPASDPQAGRAALLDHRSIRAWRRRPRGSSNASRTQSTASGAASDERAAAERAAAQALAPDRTGCACTVTSHPAWQGVCAGDAAGDAALHDFADSGSEILHGWGQRRGPAGGLATVIGVAAGEMAAVRRSMDSLELHTPQPLTARPQLSTMPARSGFNELIERDADLVVLTEAGAIVGPRWLAAATAALARTGAGPQDRARTGPGTSRAAITPIGCRSAHRDRLRPAEGHPSRRHAAAAAVRFRGPNARAALLAQ